MPESVQTFIARKKRQWEAERERRKPLRFKDIGGKGAHYWLREAWTFRIQPSLVEKVFTLERLKLNESDASVIHRGSDVGQIEYRLGYWIVAKKGAANGKWWWAQHCPLIPAVELLRIFTLAREEATIRPEDWQLTSR